MTFACDRTSLTAFVSRSRSSFRRFLISLKIGPRLDAVDVKFEEKQWKIAILDYCYFLDFVICLSWASRSLRTSLTIERASLLERTASKERL